MSSSSVKRLLRSARECLGRRDYKDTLQHCKEALAEDKLCYEAYIYVGKAAFHLTEFVQAEAAYRRASDIEPRNPLAWQGLAEIFTETGAWSNAAECYSHLLTLADAAAAEDPLHGRRAVFLRRLAEAAVRGNMLAQAEAAWLTLTDAAGASLAAATAAGDEAAAATAEEELVDSLCRLADVQLAVDTADIESRVAKRLAEEAALTPGIPQQQLAGLESAVRSAEEGEWAEEALEMDADHASASLRRIIALRPPSPPYVPYYDSFLKRLRKYIQASPPGSMERHSRRAVLLAAARATMEGHCGSRMGGCCSPYPYEAALAMLEVEHEVVGEQDTSLDPASMAQSAEPPPLPLLVADCGRIALRLSHSFPWNPTAQLHIALSLRRRAAVYGFDDGVTAAAVGSGVGGAAGFSVARLPPAAAAAGERRKQVTGLLLSALSRGGQGVSGWLAACELLLAEGAAKAALDAAKEGLKYVAHRDLVGKERLAGAALLLRLLAGQALLRLRKLDEAQLLLEGLAHSVSEGHVASGELAGTPPVNVSQHAKRYLAHVAAAHGDFAGARQRYDELVGGQLMGRNAAPIEAWAHGELGMLLLRQCCGMVEGARFHLQAALAALQPELDAAAAIAASPAATMLQQLQQEAAAYQLHLALALWLKGGGRLPNFDSTATGGGGSETAAIAAASPGPSLEPYRSDCRELLLSAAAVAGPLQAAAFTWLGHWYGRAAEPRDALKARRCYQRALALDPTQAEAGEALVAALGAVGRSEIAIQLCEEMRSRAAAAAALTTTATAPTAFSSYGGPVSPFLVLPGLLPASTTDKAGWALRSLARLQRDGGSNESAVANYQAAIRLEPADSELWEGLAASYQALGRHTAALKSYGRALELSPGRLFSRIQAATLHYQMGDMPSALSYYRTSLAAAPGNAAALLGCGEVLLAQAALAARIGASGAAAAELAEAAALAARAAGQYGNLQAGWKLLGDVRMQHAAVPTLDSVAATRGSVMPCEVASDGTAAVNAALAAGRGRLTQLQLARRAYAAAVHLDPRVAGLWGDLGMSYHLQLELEEQHPDLAPSADSQPCHHAKEGQTDSVVARRRALSLARGGLRLDPTSDWLWSCSGTIAAAAATDSPAMAAAAEFCYGRALHLNPRQAPVWAALGRLYAAHGEGGLASRCFDAARSHEPTSIAVWEAMGDAALRRGGLVGNSLATVATDPRATAAWRDAADAYEHAQLLGGDVESRLGFVLGSMTGRGATAADAADGAVLAAATKASVMQPLLASAHHARGLALEARGDFAEAVQAFQTALILLNVNGSRHPGGLEQSSISSATSLMQPFDPRVAPNACVAVQLDLARALAAAGQGNEAIDLYRKLFQEGAVRNDDVSTTLSYAMALQKGACAAEALPYLVAVLSNVAAPPRLRLTAAAAAIRIHVAARKWDDAYSVVLTVTADLPDEGYGGTIDTSGSGGVSIAEAAAKLWRILLAGIVVARAPELESQLQAEMWQWSTGRQDLNSARHECRVRELICAKYRAAGDAGAALRQAALAVRACPYDRAAWALLAHTVVQVPGPRHAVLGARAAPRERAPYTMAAAAENAAPSLATLPSAAMLLPSAVAAHAAGITAAPAAAAAVATAEGSVGTSGIVLLAAVREAAVRLRHVVHAQPHEASAWYLCALTELQHAIASGGKTRLYRSAAVAASTAAARAKAQLAALPAIPPAPAPATPPMPGLPPALAFAMASQAARAHSTAPNPQSAVLRAQHAALADVQVRALAVLSECRLQMQLKGYRGGGGGAGGGGEGKQQSGPLEAAEEALRVAAAHGMDASPAHRQLARIHVVQGDMATANVAYDQACRAAASAAGSASASGRSVCRTAVSYELLPALEWATVRAAAGDMTEAAELLSTAIHGCGGGGTIVVPARPAAALVDVAAVQRALLMLQVGEVEAARAAAVDAAAVMAGSEGSTASTVRKLSVGLQSAAHAVQAAAALMQATLSDGEAGGNAAALRKKSLLEARWAAREALKPLSLSRPAGWLGHRGSAPPPGPMGPGTALAAVLLSLAETGLGKEDVARDLQREAARLWPTAQSIQPMEVFTKETSFGASIPEENPSATAAFSPRPREGVRAAGGGGGAGGGGSGLLMRAVHCRPWAFKEQWCGLVAAVRAQ